jgi:hypothetical protein
MKLEKKYRFKKKKKRKQFGRNRTTKQNQNISSGISGISWDSE